MESENIKTVSIEEQRAEAIRHYDEAGRAVNCWLSFIYQAIKSYNPSPQPSKPEQVGKEAIELKQAAKDHAVKVGWMKAILEMDMGAEWCIRDFIAGAKWAEQAKQEAPGDAWGKGFDTAITLANNLCVQESDMYNSDDMTTQADAATNCAKQVRKYLGDRSYMPAEIFTPTPVQQSIEDPIKVIYEMLCKINHPFSEYADNEAARDMALQINHIRGYIVHEVFPAKDKTNEAGEWAKELRDYFGEHDKTPQEHRLFSIADRLYKLFEAGERK